MSQLKHLGSLVFLAAICAAAPFSTDLYLASMPTIVKQLHTTNIGVQLTLTCYFLSFALMQLIWGPLSERIGRRSALCIGMGLFCIGSVMCRLSTDIVSLIIFRTLQGAGACAGVVIGFAMVKDTCTNTDQISERLSVIISIMMLAPIVAPIIGSYLLVHFFWQANFIFLTIYSSLLFIGTLFCQETHPKANRQTLPIRQLKQRYCEQLSDRPFLMMTITVTLSFSTMFAYIAASPFVFLTIYHMPTIYFGYLFAINALALITGSLSALRLKSIFSRHDLAFIAAIITLFGAVLMCLALWLDPKAILSVIIPSFIATFGMGILFPTTTALALSHVRQFTGIATALIGTIRFTCAGFIAYLIGTLLSTSPWPLAVTMTVLATLACCICGIYRKSTLRLLRGA